MWGRRERECKSEEGGRRVAMEVRARMCELLNLLFINCSFRFYVDGRDIRYSFVVLKKEKR